MHKVFCDKCDKEFWAWQQEYRYEVKICEKGIFPRTIDLCDNCRKAFEDWMDKFIENEEEWNGSQHLRNSAHGYRG